MIDVITMSSKGQVVIPSGIREEMGLSKQDKFIITHEDDSIIMKKLKPGNVNKKAMRLLDDFAKKFEAAGLTADNVEMEIKRNRR